MAGKRLQLARIMMAMGVPDLWSRGSGTTLLILNYHRVWGPGQSRSDFDDGVFDVDIETFRRQMRWLQSVTEVLDEGGLLDVVAGARKPPATHLSAVTFDDGYVECFTLVKPVLDALGIKGMFFIPVDILKSRRLGWWDLAAYMLKRSRKSAVNIRGQRYELGAGLQNSLKRILNIFKLEAAHRTEGLVAEIAGACEVEPPSIERQDSELMSWDQIRALHASGHAIGSHAWSHRPLATLTADDQAREIHESRRALEGALGSAVRSFAYPVGGPRHFNETSTRLVREAGYRQAFSFNTGIASLPIVDPFRIPRESAKSFELLKAKTLMPGLMGLRSKPAA